ncbi:Lar family restriction alleviation protein [Stenotrophomonas maltophilia]|uniref:Lar family restriction alleviation protein n=1 Tax=Stenotrophomonas maltophilia TaxID=40324 RepID=UPI0021C6D417|nr:Lar family restriction alleviation protein [Stenotrophomonas maltophilia]MCU1140659.1 Lar family restriction alleviation protein [Stenotrophomonas maltophilia]
MSNDIKTLADVQPGGRVRLGDQAELDRHEFQAWTRELLPCPFCGNVAEFVPYKDNGLTLKCKSMGCIQRNQRTLRYGIDWLRTSMAEHWNTRALSARQPAYVKGCDELRARTEGERAAYMEGLEEGKKIAARQPVGELAEPIFQIKHHDDTEATWRDATEAAYEMQPTALRRIVYAAPPVGAK